MDDRGVTPVVGKSLEIAVVLAYIAVVAGVLYGGVVPSVEASSESRQAEVTLARAATAIERAVPATGRSPSVRYQVGLPDSIGGQSYRIDWANDSLRLRHPDHRLQTRVTIPRRVVAIQGNWSGPGVVVVNESEDGWVVTLTAGDR